jgi:hypothetical protein
VFGELCIHVLVVAIDKMIRQGAKHTISRQGNRSVRQMIGSMLCTAIFVGLSCSPSIGFSSPNAIPRSALIVHASSIRNSINEVPLKPGNLHVSSKRQHPLHMSSEAKDPNEEPASDANDPITSKDRSWVDELIKTFPFFQLLQSKDKKKMPPLIVEDNQLLLYDLVLILNLTVSISLWVVHRMSFDFIAPALSEGSLMCILWIIAGLYNGAFLYSAVDGHYASSDDRGGPKAAGMLGLHTFINAANLRVMVALASAVLEHRKVGIVPGEDLVPLEIAFGLVLLSMWRLLHSSFTPRV